MRIQSLKKIKRWTGKTVLLRLDFNVPIRGGKISEDYKIRTGLATIKFLSAAGARVVIISHLADPDGRPRAEDSLRPVAARLRSLLRQPLRFLPETTGPRVKKAIRAMTDGGVIMLENLRFHSGEYRNEKKFAGELASLADIYVNDAFAASHRLQASVARIKEFLPAYAGLLLEQEVLSLEKVIKPKKPLVLILGGAKVSTKAPLIARLQARSFRILIGGVLANNFFRAQGLEIGRSLVDIDSGPVVKKFLKDKKLFGKICLPLDLVVKGRGQKVRVVRPEAVGEADQILDIGPATISVYSEYIKKAKTIFWNGPMGKFEERPFRHGTVAIGILVAARAAGLAYGVVGGGETVAALEQTGLAEDVDRISTGGGATLTYISGAKMPGLIGIIKH